MGKVKEMLLNNRDLYCGPEIGEGYNEFLYNQLEKYSASDVMEALKYGVESIQLTTNEVGSDVYGKLLEEAVFEYLDTIQ